MKRVQSTERKFIPARISTRIIGIAPSISTNRTTWNNTHPGISHYIMLERLQLQPWMEFFFWWATTSGANTNLQKIQHQWNWINLYVRNVFLENVSRLAFNNIYVLMKTCQLLFWLFRVVLGKTIKCNPKIHCFLSKHNHMLSQKREENIYCF